MSDHRMFGGIVSLSNIFRYKGLTFEWHNFCGPMLLRKDGEPAKRKPDKKFYALTHEWHQLPKKKRERYRIAG